MFIECLASWGDPVQLITPFLILIVIGSLSAWVLPGKILDQMAARFEGLGVVGMIACFGTALVLAQVVSPAAASATMNTLF